MARDDIFTHAQRERAIRYVSTKRSGSERDLWDITGIVGIVVAIVALNVLNLDREAGVLITAWAIASFLAYWSLRIAFDSIANTERDQLRRLDDRELITKLKIERSSDSRRLLREVGEPADG